VKILPKPFSRHKYHIAPGPEEQDVGLWVKVFVILREDPVRQIRVACLAGDVPVRDIQIP
jgi:hypothetical protein